MSTEKLNEQLELDNPADLQHIIDLILQESDKGGLTKDPFFRNSEEIALYSVLHYLRLECPKEQQTVSNIQKLFSLSDYENTDSDYICDFEYLVEKLQIVNPRHQAAAYFSMFMAGTSIRTRKTVLEDILVSIRTLKRA